MESHLDVEAVRFRFGLREQGGFSVDLSAFPKARVAID
jgi:hypothetical protein